MSELKDFIAGMPKAELHVHLEGTLEPSSVRLFAERNHLPLPSSLQEGGTDWNFHDLASLLPVYYSNMTVLRTAQDFHDLTWSYLITAHQQNIVHAELFFDPQAHTSRGIDFATVMSGCYAAAAEAEKKLGMSVSFIMCFSREMDAESAMATLLAALPYKDKIVGVGLDSDERGNPPNKFTAVFAKARIEGFKLTVHCDIDQNNSIEHIRQAIEDIRVDRIDHGANIVEEKRLVDLVRQRHIGLTCCPVSNSVVSDDFKGREIKSLLHDGVKVTLNSDDPAYFRAYLNENIEFMSEKMSLTKKDLVQLQKNAFEISWISAQEKSVYIGMLEDYAELQETIDRPR